MKGDQLTSLTNIVVGFGLLFGVFYIYLLRMRQFRRIKSRSGGSSKSSKTGGSSAGGRKFSFLVFDKTVN